MVKRRRQKKIPLAEVFMRVNDADEPEVEHEDRTEIM